MARAEIVGLAAVHSARVQDCCVGQVDAILGENVTPNRKLSQMIRVNGQVSIGLDLCLHLDQLPATAVAFVLDVMIIII